MPSISAGSDMFTQAPGTTGRSNGDLGVGWVSSRSLVQLHGGQSARVPRGTARKRVPLQPATAARYHGARGGGGRNRATPGATSAAGDATVLVADDNADAAWGMA